MDNMPITEVTHNRGTVTYTTWTGGFGHWLKDTRTRLGLSQLQLAKRAGVKKQSVHRWENGELPTVKSYLHLMRALDKPVSGIEFVPRTEAEPEGKPNE